MDNYYHYIRIKNEISLIKKEINILESTYYGKNRLEKMNNLEKITEIRIEEIKDYDNNEFYYYIYCVKDTGERIEIGKSSTKPTCYKQVAIYN